MAEDGMKDILLMALFMVTRDDVLACANELGMPEEQVTDDVIAMVKDKVSQSLGDCREVIRGMIKDAFKKEVFQCPLGLVCSPFCAWREAGGCILPRGVK